MAAPKRRHSGCKPVTQDGHTPNESSPIADPGSTISPPLTERSRFAAAGMLDNSALLETGDVEALRRGAGTVSG
jgi:hypothetical protein